MLVIIDYGVGNLASISNMFRRVGAQSLISGRPEDIANADKLILPGVGAFDDVMRKYGDSGLAEVIERRVCGDGVPVLGICVGMQMLSEGSEEGQLSGLGWVAGHCERLTDLPEARVPHMGWNRVTRAKSSALTDGLPEDARFYFAHSYHVVCRDVDDVLMTANHGKEIVSAVQKGNIFGVQFHPEKSHRFGMELFRQFDEI